MSADNKAFWPNWLGEDVPGVSVFTLGYPASLFRKWAKREMDLYERAGSALDYMSAKGLGERPIVFVAHSLGGLLAKQILRTSSDTTHERWQQVAERTKLVIFLSTPHNGASLASVLKFAFPRFASKHIDMLTQGGGALTDINNHYRALCDKKDELSTVVFYEKHLTHKLAMVVDKASADPGVARCWPVAHDKDHISICKPADREDSVYIGILRPLKDLVDDPRHRGEEYLSFDAVGHSLESACRFVEQSFDTAISIVGLSDHEKSIPLRPVSISGYGPLKVLEAMIKRVDGGLPPEICVWQKNDVIFIGRKD